MYMPLNIRANRRLANLFKLYEEVLDGRDVIVCGAVDLIQPVSFDRLVDVGPI